MQLQFMRENMSGMSEEDIRALSEAINESGRPDLIISVEPNVAEDTDTILDSDEEEDDDNPDNWDYDRLLQIGQQIGDVKTERWRLRSSKAIEELPTVIYSEYCIESVIILQSIKYSKTY